MAEEKAPAVEFPGIQVRRTANAKAITNPRFQDLAPRAETKADMLLETTFNLPALRARVATIADSADTWKPAARGESEAKRNNSKSIEIILGAMKALLMGTDVQLQHAMSKIDEMRTNVIGTEKWALLGRIDANVKLIKTKSMEESNPENVDMLMPEDYYQTSNRWQVKTLRSWVQKADTFASTREALASSIRRIESDQKLTADDLSTIQDEWNIPSGTNVEGCAAFLAEGDRFTNTTLQEMFEKTVAEIDAERQSFIADYTKAAEDIPTAPAADIFTNCKNFEEASRPSLNEFNEEDLQNVPNVWNRYTMDLLFARNPGVMTHRASAEVQSNASIQQSTFAEVQRDLKAKGDLLWAGTTYSDVVNAWLDDQSIDVPLDLSAAFKMYTYEPVLSDDEKKAEADAKAAEEIAKKAEADAKAADEAAKKAEADAKAADEATKKAAEEKAEQAAADAKAAEEIAKKAAEEAAKRPAKPAEGENKTPLQDLGTFVELCIAVLTKENTDDVAKSHTLETEEWYDRLCNNMDSWNKQHSELATTANRVQIVAPGAVADLQVHYEAWTADMHWKQLYWATQCVDLCRIYRLIAEQCSVFARELQKNITRCHDQLSEMSKFCVLEEPLWAMTQAKVDSTTTTVMEAYYQEADTDAGKTVRRTRDNQNSKTLRRYRMEEMSTQTAKYVRLLNSVGRLAAQMRNLADGTYAQLSATSSIDWEKGVTGAPTDSSKLVDYWRHLNTDQELRLPRVDGTYAEITASYAADVTQFMRCLRQLNAADARTLQPMCEAKYWQCDPVGCLQLLQSRTQALQIPTLVEDAYKCDFQKGTAGATNSARKHNRRVQLGPDVASDEVGSNFPREIRKLWNVTKLRHQVAIWDESAVWYVTRQDSIDTVLTFIESEVAKKKSDLLTSISRDRHHANDITTGLVTNIKNTVEAIEIIANTNVPTLKSESDVVNAVRRRISADSARSQSSLRSWNNHSMPDLSEQIKSLKSRMSGNVPSRPAPLTGSSETLKKRPVIPEMDSDEEVGGLSDDDDAKKEQPDGAEDEGNDIEILQPTDEFVTWTFDASLPRQLQKQTSVKQDALRTLTGISDLECCNVQPLLNLKSQKRATHAVSVLPAKRQEIDGGGGGGGGGVELARLVTGAANNNKAKTVNHSRVTQLLTALVAYVPGIVDESRRLVNRESEHDTDIFIIDHDLQHMLNHIDRRLQCKVESDMFRRFQGVVARYTAESTQWLLTGMLSDPHDGKFLKYLEIKFTQLQARGPIPDPKAYDEALRAQIGAWTHAETGAMRVADFGKANFCVFEFERSTDQPQCKLNLDNARVLSWALVNGNKSDLCTRRIYPLCYVYESTVTGMFDIVDSGQQFYNQHKSHVHFMIALLGQLKPAPAPAPGEAPVVPVAVAVDASGSAYALTPGTLRSRVLGTCPTRMCPLCGYVGKGGDSKENGVLPFESHIYMPRYLCAPYRYIEFARDGENTSAFETSFVNCMKLPETFVLLEQVIFNEPAVTAFQELIASEARQRTADIYAAADAVIDLLTVPISRGANRMFKRIEEVVGIGHLKAAHFFKCAEVLKPAFQRLLTTLVAVHESGAGDAIKPAADRSWIDPLNPLAFRELCKQGMRVLLMNISPDDMWQSQRTADFDSNSVFRTSIAETLNRFCVRPTGKTMNLFSAKERSFTESVHFGQYRMQPAAPAVVAAAPAAPAEAAAEPVVVVAPVAEAASDPTPVIVEPLMSQLWNALDDDVDEDSTSAAAPIISSIWKDVTSADFDAAFASLAYLARRDD